MRISKVFISLEIYVKETEKLLCKKKKKIELIIRSYIDSLLVTIEFITITMISE